MSGWFVQLLYRPRVVVSGIPFSSKVKKGRKKMNVKLLSMDIGGENSHRPHPRTGEHGKRIKGRYKGWARRNPTTKCCHKNISVTVLDDFPFKAIIVFFKTLSNQNSRSTLPVICFGWTRLPHDNESPPRVTSNEPSVTLRQIEAKSFRSNKSLKVVLTRK